MKAVTKSNWGLGIYLAPWNMWNQDQEARFYFKFAKVKEWYAKQNEDGKSLNLNYDN